jgi:predicted nucleic acid-binding protein
MIYLDTSVALAHLLSETRRPAPDFWRSSLVASRLLEHEVWTRLHGRGLAVSHASAAQALLQRVAFVELAPAVLKRALEPFPMPVRTLDALHLASLDFLRTRGLSLALASYDDRLLAAARALGVEIAEA